MFVESHRKAGKYIRVLDLKALYLEEQAFEQEGCAHQLGTTFKTC